MINESTVRILKTLDKYKIFIGIGVGVAIALGVGGSLLVKGKTLKSETAWQSIWKIQNDLSTANRQRGQDEKTRNEILTSAANTLEYMKENTSAGVMPWLLLQLGNIYFDLKNYDGAIDEYNDFLGRYGSHPMTPVVKQSLGYAYEEKGRFQDAVKQFDGGSLSNDNSLSAQKGWDAGRCYEKLGQTDDAIRTYTSAVEISPDSIWATMAQYRLSVIQ
ncbi:MAG: tetratricopeptide repeat protein [Candidatus Brocadiaceae bacterium]|nr:tetratricopeptide repeat protein [Candidatus Brocadiaceae bacterium]